ncbi:MAG: hypothetical protein E7403_00505 [Ruminococcaceae bacterium]|nr:hypothetical protein [Oscillospiraceae bacterium]
MVKFLGKKVLATLIVLSLVVTLAPFAFAANSTTSVTKYSDLGLTGLTPHYQLTVDNDHGMTEDYTPTRDADGKVTEKTLPTANYNLTAFQKANTNVRGFNRGTNQKRTADAYASFDGDTDNMVAKIYGGPIKDATGTVTTTYDLVSRSVAMGANNAQAAGSNHPLRPIASKAGTKFVWEIKVKFSDVTSGSYRLFQADYNSSSYIGGRNSGNDVYVSTIGIENGDVFVLPAGKYDYNLNNINSKTYMTDTIVDGKLENDRWYTFVKVVEYDSTRGAYDASSQAYITSETAHYEGKVYVFDDQGDCIGGHDDMRDFGRTGDIYSLAFSTIGMAEGDYVLVDDFKVYKISDPSIDCAAADSNNAITMSQGDAPLTFTAQNFNFVPGDVNKITLTNGSNENVGTVSFINSSTIQADLSALPAAGSPYTLTFDNITNPVGKNIEKTYNITIQSPTFSVDKVEFVRDDEATSVDAITKGTKVKAKVTMTNSGEAQDYVIFLALYKGNQLEQIIYKIGKTDAVEKAYITDALTVESDDMTACIYVWDTWADIQPLTEATPFE